jgi:hypothetical protein
MATLETIETVKKLAEVTGWSIDESRVEAIAAVYEAVMEDTRLLRVTDLKDSIPSTILTE